MGRYPKVYTSIEKLQQKLVNIKEGNPMFWPLSVYRLMHPKERYIWVQVRILRETDKAVLIDNGMKTWIPKSRTHGIKLKNSTFEIYVKESTIG